LSTRAERIIEIHSRLEQFADMGLGDTIARAYGISRRDLDLLAFISDQVREFRKVK